MSNETYRDSYRRILVVLLGMVLVAIAQTAILGLMVWGTGTPNYYATTVTGRVIRIYPLSEPVVTNSYLLQWAETVGRSSYNLDFVHYQDQIDQLKTYFTPQGWQKFMEALNASGDLDAITQNKLFVSAVVNGPAVILLQTELRGRYVWRVQMPLLVTYTSASDKHEENIILTMDIMRVEVLDAPKGILVNNFIAIKRAF